MKKLLISCCLITAATASVHADVLELPDFNDGHAHWIVRTGIGFNDVTGDNIDTQKAMWEDKKMDGNFKSTTGFQVNIGFNKSFGKHPLYWGMNLGIGTRGYETEATKFSDTGTINTSVGNAGSNSTTRQSGTLNTYNVMFSPFNIGYKYSFLGKMAVDVHLGAFVSYDFAGENKASSDRVVNYYAGKVKHESSESKAKIGDIKTFNNFDAGMNLGFGVWYGHFNLDLSWQRGFIAIWDKGDEDVKIGKKTRKQGNLYSSNLQLSVAYCF